MNQNTKHKRKPSSFSKLKKICESYGAKVNADDFSIQINFNDGKSLHYMLDHSNGLSTILEDIERKGIHGRVFKDFKFIGYAPEKKSLDEILVRVDLMM